MDTQVEIQNFTVVREVLITDLTIALVLTTFFNKPKEFKFIQQTVSHHEVHVV